MTTVPERTFVARLRRALQVRGMNLSELARRLGVSPSSVTNWISRGSSPLIGTAADVADVLDVNLDWLAGRTDVEPDWCKPASDGGAE
jgi:transcriptional regulator with XRE-family HTH domain